MVDGEVAWMIERLVLKDFKSHGGSDIKFDSGLTIFLGEVGAGKTSVLEGISFALFGRCAGNITQSELIRRGAEKAEVSLVFSTKSGRYKVERMIHPEKTQKASLWIFAVNDWSLAVEGVMAVSNSIEDLLEADSSTFLAALYASQDEIKEMLETQPGKRRERLDKLLGIDTYERIWRTLGDARNMVLNELTQAQDEASGVDVLEKQIKGLKDRLERNKREMEMLESFSMEIEDRLQLAEQQLEVFEELKEELSQLETQIKAKNNEIKNSSATQESLKEKMERASGAEKVFQENKPYVQLEKDLEKEKRRIEIALQRKESLERILQRDKEALQEAVNRRSRLEAQKEKMRILQESLKALEKEREDLPGLREQQAVLEKKCDEANKEATEVLIKTENQERKVERITELGECPTCLQVVPEEHKDKIKGETVKAVAKLKADYALLKESGSQVQKKLDDIKKKIEIASLADRKYAETIVQVRMLEGCKEELEEVEARVTNIQFEIKENMEKTTEIIETLETLAEVTAKLMGIALKASLAREAEKQMAAKKDLKAMLHTEEEKLKLLELQLSELSSSEKDIAEKYNPKEHEETENSVKTLREDRAKNKEGIERLSKSMGDDELQVKQTEKQLEEKRKAWKQVQELKKENKILETLRNSLREAVQPVMRKNNVLRVSEAFQAFYQELSNDNIDYAALDEEGNLDVVRNGEPSPVNSLSGGETTCAALALRLAICSSLTKNQLLLLDEPTIHLDELYRAKLRDFLGNHSFEQLIVVTHDNTFDSLPARIFRVEKQRGESIVSSLNQGGA